MDNFINIVSNKQPMDVSISLADILGIDFFAFWFYPETDEEIKNELLSKFECGENQYKKLEPITTYNDSNDYTACAIPANTKNLNMLKDIPLVGIDSIGFYIDTSWAYCYIPHEDIIIAKNEYRQNLKQSGILFQTVPPKGW